MIWSGKCERDQEQCYRVSLPSALPGLGPRWGRASVSGPDHEVSVSSCHHVNHTHRPVNIRTLLQTWQIMKYEAGKWKCNSGFAQGALTSTGMADSMSLVYIRQFTMIQHVQLRLPCLQSRTKTTCNYQKYTFSSITWYVNKPTNVRCLCWSCWVNNIEERFNFFEFCCILRIVLLSRDYYHLSQDKSVTIWRYDISKLSPEFWRNGKVE